MGVNINLNDHTLLDSFAAKAGQAKALLLQIANDYAPAVFANSLGAEGITNYRGIVCLLQAVGQRPVSGEFTNICYSLFRREDDCLRSSPSLH